MSRFTCVRFFAQAQVAHFREDFTTDFRMTRISLKQKGTKGTKEEFFFVAFVCFCANFILWAAWVEDSESVKSVKSVVHSLRLRLAALGSFAGNILSNLHVSS